MNERSRQDLACRSPDPRQSEAPAAIRTHVEWRSCIELSAIEVLETMPVSSARVAVIGAGDASACNVAALAPFAGAFAFAALARPAPRRLALAREAGSGWTSTLCLPPA